MATRLRRTFKYPADDDASQDLSHALDEQAQDELIANFQTQNQHTDATYIQLFTLLPLLCIPGFLFFLIRPSSSSAIRFISVLGITSLLASALTMYLTPLDSRGQVKGSPGVLEVPGLGRVDSDGPLGRMVPVLNGGVCVVLGIAGWGLRRRAGLGDVSVPEGLWVFCLVPGVLAGVVWFVKRTMNEVRAEVGELKGLRYDLRGA